jgi:Helix-turn-helix family
VPGWPSYFAWRAAPLGAAGPSLVASAFYSFSPVMVAEHVPAAWGVASPQQVLVARMRAASQAYRALLGDLIGSPALADAAVLAREAALAAPTAGCPLAAANADLPWPDEPHLVLWHAIGVLRASRRRARRGAADGRSGPVRGAGVVRRHRRRARRSLWQSRLERGGMGRGAGPARVPGWVDADGKATERGRDGRDEIEWRTDRLADAPWVALGADRAQRLAELTRPLLGAAVRPRLLPVQSTLGIAAVPFPPRDPEKSPPLRAPGRRSPSPPRKRRQEWRFRSRLTSTVRRRTCLRLSLTSGTCPGGMKQCSGSRLRPRLRLGWVHGSTWSGPFPVVWHITRSS